VREKNKLQSGSNPKSKEVQKKEKCLSLFVYNRTLQAGMLFPKDVTVLITATAKFKKKKNNNPEEQITSRYQ